MNHEGILVFRVAAGAVRRYTQRLDGPVPLTEYVSLPALRAGLTHSRSGKPIVGDGTRLLAGRALVLRDQGLVGSSPTRSASHPDEVPAWDSIAHPVVDY